MIPNSLKQKLITAAAGGAISIAGVLVYWAEGRIFTPYKDTGGIYTVCEGHTGPDIDPQRLYTDADCDAFKRQDIAKAAAAVNRLVRVPVTSYQQAALIDFVYNLGPTALANSTLLARLNARDYEGACKEYGRWVHGRVNGRLVELQALVNRRAADEWLCLLDR